MYKTRIHFEHDNLHLALDSMTGELLEICTGRNGDNLIKNAMYDLHQPFALVAEDGGVRRQLFPVHSRAAIYRPELRVAFETEERDGGLLVTVRYPYVSDGEKEIPADLYYTVFLRGEQLEFRLYVKHIYGSGKMTEVRFPVIPGVYLGRSYQDDTLMFPWFCGMQCENPVNFFSRPPQHVHWRWQEYRYSYITDGHHAPGRLHEQGLKGISGRYPGETSMSWMDLYDGTDGVYFGCHTPAGQPCTLDAGVYGDHLPGIMLAAVHEPYLEPEQVYETPPTVMALHAGDWHEGAKIYRAFRKPQIRMHDRKMPAWAKESAALFAHYDFKYQNGGVVHHYRDIPKMAEEAREAGIFHMLFSGWHLDGFDNGFPMYITDPELGTEEEFIEGIRRAKEMGVHTSFYVNMRLHNVRYHEDTIAGKAIMHENGEIKYSRFGNGDILFADMCPASQEWHDEVLAFTRHATDVYGADGLYYDVLNANGVFCFNPAHDHRFDDYARGNLQILTDVRLAYDSTHEDSLMILGEFTSDQLGGVMTLQLNQLFSRYHTGGYPNMYRYTFPEHGTVDMVYPGKNMAMRPVHVAHIAEDLMASAFTNGSYFWVYDLVDDNTFTRDPENFALLKDLIRLRKIQLREWGDCLFCDTDGITVPPVTLDRTLTGCGSAGVMVRRFTGTEGSLLTCFRFTEEDAWVTFTEPIREALLILPDGSRTVLPVAENRILLPGDKAFLIAVS
ncbi:MAG: hypothetical protein IJ480_10065 [Clostridia bacterium]|nr:hypothetical protein [Clostridia bacterium]